MPVEQLAEALTQIRIYEISIGQFAQGQVDGDEAQIELLGPQPAQRSDIALALDFLRLIEDQELMGGAAQQEVMTILGAAHAKGIGSKAAVVNRVIDAAGFAIPDVYTNARDSSGARTWRAGPDLAKALEAITSGPRRRHVLREPMVPETSLKDDPDEL